MIGNVEALIVKESTVRIPGKFVVSGIMVEFCEFRLRETVIANTFFQLGVKNCGI